MHNKNLPEIVRTMLVFILSILTILLILEANKLQGTARVINYAGLLRGETQQLIKNELAHEPKDELIENLEEILLELQTGRGSYNLRRIRDPLYVRDLEVQKAAWLELKQEIYHTRRDPAREKQLYDLSEKYLVISNHTVKAVEVYTDEIVQNLQSLEFWDSLTLLGLILMYLLKLQEFRKLSRRNSLLSTLAYMDPATGLANKRSCEQRLANPNPIAPDILITCFMFDLNNLKTTNDTLGHEKGDLLIAQFAEALKKAALPHVFIGRYGGDEFIAVAVGVPPEENQAFLQRLQIHIEAWHQTSHDIRIQYATGVAYSSEFPNCTVRELMQKADQRMYADKAKKKKFSAAAPLSS